MKDINNSLASKDKSLRETLKSSSSPRASNDTRISPVANGNTIDYAGFDSAPLMPSVTPPAGDGTNHAPDSSAQAPPPTTTMGSLVDYLMSGPGKKAAKKLQKEANAERSAMVHGHMVHQVTTVGVHTPPPRLATPTPPPQVLQYEETWGLDRAMMTMDEVVEQAVHNKDTVTRGFEREAQEARPKVPQNNAKQDKDEAHAANGDEDSTLPPATGGDNDTLQHGSSKASLASQFDGSTHTNSSVLTSGTKTSSRPGSSDRAANSSRPPSNDRAVTPKRPNSKDKAISSSRPPSRDRPVTSSRPTSKERTTSSSRPNSKGRPINSSRSTSRDRATATSRPTSKERAMNSSRPSSRDRGMSSSRPSSRERGSRTGPPTRPTSRERQSNTTTDKKSSLAAVEEGREAAARHSRPTSRGGDSIHKPQKPDHGLPPTSAPKPGRSRSSADSPWSKLAATHEKQNQEKNVAKLYHRLIKKHVSGNKTEPFKEPAGDKGAAMADHASKYRVLSQTPDLRDGSPLQPTREEVQVQKNDVLLVGVPLSFNSGSSRPQTPKQDTASSVAAPKEGHTMEQDSNQVSGREIQPGRSLLASMAEHNFLNSRYEQPEASEQVVPQDKQAASTSHSQEIRPVTALDGANQSTQKVTEKSGSQPGSGKQATTDQSITEDGVAGSPTSVKDSGSKVPTLASVPSRAALSGSGENNADGDPGEASPLTQGNVGTSSSVKTVSPRDPLKPQPHSDHGTAPVDTSRGAVFPRAPEHPAPYAPSLRGDVLVKALEESARTNAGDRIALPQPQAQSVMPYHVAPRGSTLSAVEIPEPTLSTVSLAVSKNAADMGRPMPLRDQGNGGIFDRFTSNSSSTSLWHKITPLAVRPSNDSYYREPREYEDYLPREPARPVLQRRNSLGRINTRDYEEDDYYYENDDYNDNSRYSRVRESRGAQTVRVKNQQPRHGILKKTEPRPVRKEESRNTILDKMEDYRHSPPIIIASGIVPKNLESLTSEYQATRGVSDSQRNGTKNHAPKEKEHFQDRHAETGTGVAAPLLASSGQKQSIGDVFDRLHNNRRLEHAALVSRRPELKQKPKAIPAKTKEKDAGLASITPRAPATEPQRHHLQNGGKDVYTRLYQNAVPSRKRRDEFGEATRLLDNAAPHAPAPTVAFRHETHKSSPRASKDLQKTRPADHVIDMPLLAPDIVVDDIAEPAPIHPGYVDQTGKGGNDKIPIVLLQGFFQGPGVRSPHHRRPSMSVNELTLPPHLVDVTSVIRGALPVLPRSLAALCLTLNILLPGLGTAASGWLGLCWGRNRMGAVETSGHRFTSVVVTAATGLVQLFTVTFFLVGWFWGVAWGILLVSIASEWAVASSSPHSVLET